MNQVLSRVRVLMVAAGLCVGLASCEQKDDSADALQKANGQLASLNPFGTPAASVKFKTDTYSSVIKSLQSVSRDGSASQKAAASLLIAQSEAGLAEPAATRAGELERAALNSLSGIRSRLDQFLNQTSNAAASASYDPSKEVASIEQSDKEKGEQIKAEQTKKAVIDKKVADLKAQAKAKADEARALQQEAGAMRTKVPNLNATEGEKVLVKAREIARRADALEVEAAALDAEAARTAPEALEGQNAIDRYNKQRELLAKERGEIAKRTQAAKDLAAAMRADAAKTAEEIKKAVAQIEELRAGDLKSATDTAISGYGKASTAAKSAASEMKATAQMTVGSANQSLADVHLARAQCLQAFAQVLDSLAIAKPALPDADSYKSKADETRGAAKEAVEAAREAYKAADAAYGAAGATGEAKTRLEKLNGRLRNLVKATGGDVDLIPARGEVAPETPAPEPAAASAGAAASGSPQETIQALIDIEASGAFDKMADYFLFPNEEDRNVFKSVLVIGPAMKHLDAATKAKFGQSFSEFSKQMGKNKVGNMGKSPMPSLSGMKASDAQVKVEGDTATVIFPGESDGMKMKLKDGKWLIDGSEIPIDQMKMMGPMMSAMAGAMNEVASDVESGKLTDMNAVMLAIGQKVMNMQGGGPGGG